MTETVLEGLGQLLVYMAATDIHSNLCAQLAVGGTILSLPTPAAGPGPTDCPGQETQGCHVPLIHLRPVTPFAK
jgi:hypothetical protein